MKKLLALILAVAMVLSMAVVTNAATAGTGEEVIWEWTTAGKLPKELAADAWGTWLFDHYTTNADAGFYDALKVEGAKLCIEINETWANAGYWMQFQMLNSGSVSSNTSETTKETIATGTKISVDANALVADFETKGGDSSDFKFQIARGGSDYAYSITAVYVTAPKAEEEEEGPTTIVEVTESAADATFSAGPFSSVQYGSSSIEANVVTQDSRITFDWYYPNIAGVITSVASLEDITHVKVTVTADNAETWPYPEATWNKTPTVMLRTQDNGGYGVIESDAQFNPATGVAVIEFDMVDGTILAKNKGWNSDEANIGTYVDASKLILIPSGFNPDLAVVNFTVSVDVTYETEVEGSEEEEDAGRKSGYIVTGDETHAIIIGKAIITTKHEFDADGDCLYCRYHKDIVSEDIEVVQPTESTEEETEDIVVEEPKEDTNPTTGIALAVIPMIMAAAAIVISKR